MAITVQRAHGLAVYQDGAAVADRVVVQRAHGLAVYQDGAAAADRVVVPRAHGFAVYQDANADKVANAVTLRRAHGFVVYRQVPQFSIEGDQLKLTPAHVGVHPVTVRVTDDNGATHDESFNVTVTDT